MSPNDPKAKSASIDLPKVWEAGTSGAASISHQMYERSRRAVVGRDLDRDDGACCDAAGVPWHPKLTSLVVGPRDDLTDVIRRACRHSGYRTALVSRPPMHRQQMLSLSLDLMLLATSVQLVSTWVGLIHALGLGASRPWIVALAPQWSSPTIAGLLDGGVDDVITGIHLRPAVLGAKLITYRRHLVHLKQQRDRRRKADERPTSQPSADRPSDHNASGPG